MSIRTLLLVNVALVCSLTIAFAPPLLSWKTTYQLDYHDTTSCHHGTSTALNYDGRPQQEEAFDKRSVNQTQQYTPSRTSRRDDGRHQKGRPSMSKSTYFSKQDPKAIVSALGSATKVANNTEACSIVRNINSAKQINAWMEGLVNEKLNYKTSNIPGQVVLVLDGWTTGDQNDFVRLLKDCKAFDAMLSFITHFASQDVYVYTTGIFAMGMSVHHRHLAMVLLNQMEQRGIQPTAVTCTAVLGSIDGPDAVLKVMNRFKAYSKAGVEWNVDMFDSAIYACGREKRQPKRGRDHRQKNNNNINPRLRDRSWQTAMRLFHQMRQYRLAPTTNTYVALLRALAPTGQVKIALSLLDGLQHTPNLKLDDRVWGAAINICAQASDYKASIRVIQQMQQLGVRPSLRHCTALLKALTRSGQDHLALIVLEMMLGNVEHSSITFASSTKGDRFSLSLPPTAPDLIALNTVLSACSKAGNFKGTKDLFDRIKEGAFIDPQSGHSIAPDRISYHCVLAACRDPNVARDIVKEVSGRRVGRVLYGVLVKITTTSCLTPTLLWFACSACAPLSCRVRCASHGATATEQCLLRMSRMPTP
jgi:pentatricopeptide repeat protein